MLYCSLRAARAMRGELRFSVRVVYSFFFYTRTRATRASDSRARAPYDALHPDPDHLNALLSYLLGCIPSPMTAPFGSLMN